MAQLGRGAERDHGAVKTPREQPAARPLDPQPLPLSRSLEPRAGRTFEAQPVARGEREGPDGHTIDHQWRVRGLAQQRVTDRFSETVTRPTSRAKRSRGDRHRPMALLKVLNRLFHAPAWLTFLVMGLAAGCLALCSFNLLSLFQANFNLIATYGAMAACDVVFKGCLDGLLQRIHKARG